MTEKQGGSDVRANTTVARAAERRRPGRGIRDHRAQVVLLGADVRRLPRPCAGGRRAVVLRAAADPPGRHAQPVPPPATEGQARKPLQRVQRGRVRRRLGAHARRGGPRCPDDHRDGQPHAARLRARFGDRHAQRGRAGRTPRRAPRGVRQDADRPAADAERPGRPVRRVRGRDDHRRCASRAPTIRLATTRGRTCSSGSPQPCRSTGSASAARRTRTSRSSASAATGSSRSPACRACTARRRSTRSGKDPATWRASTSCVPWSRAPSRWRSSSTRSSRRPALTRAVGDALSGLKARAVRLRERGDACPPHRRADGAHPPGRAARPQWRPGGRRRVLRVTAGRRLGPRLRHPAGRCGQPGDHRPPPAGPAPASRRLQRRS